MRWLFGGASLRKQGVLGINRRNLECILDQNHRPLFPLVDDKLLMRDLCLRIGVPTPEVISEIEFPRQIQRLREFLPETGDCVLKPARGSGGRGIVLLTGCREKDFITSGGRPMSLSALQEIAGEILSGIHSLDGQPDKMLIQRRVRLHRSFEPIIRRGMPDIRIILYRGEPAMAMLRLPTFESGGRANLHQGGIGVGIDLEEGRTHHAIRAGKSIQRHPDTGAELLNRVVPFWSVMKEIARKIARATGLGWLGVDLVLDAEQGPMLLEANARPGLAIQLANREGLRHRLREIDERFLKAEG